MHNYGYRIKFLFKIIDRTDREKIFKKSEDLNIVNQINAIYISRTYIMKGIYIRWGGSMYILFKCM